jgi:alpha/beta superfamily hydrolase
MSGAHESRSLLLPGPVGPLEGILWSPAGGAAPALACVVCHPHPLFGGTMHNKVVYQAAKSLDSLGLAVLRFNFRGVGKSAGTHDDGDGELGDVRSALDFLASEFPAVPQLVAGFSFGSRVGLRVGCADDRVTQLIGLGIPVNRMDFSFLAQCTKPKLFVQGGNDQFGAMDKAREVVGSLPEPKRLVEVPNADHFFAGKLDQLDTAIVAWVRERLSAANTAA